MFLKNKSNTISFDITDVHCHILPGIDDGSKDMEMTEELLHKSKEQGVNKIICTPHYYSDKSIKEFLEKRNASAKKMISEFADKGIRINMQMLLGAEVYYNSHLKDMNDLHKLCIGSTKYMLLEMPFEKWSDRVLKDIELFSGTYGITPIIAHVERYIPYNSKTMINDLYSLPVMIQMNANYIITPSTRKKALKMIDEGRVDFLGSDCHNNTTRLPNLLQAYEIVYDSKCSYAADKFCSNADMLFEGNIL